MLLLKGLTKSPWWIAIETENGWYDLFHTGNPFIDSEAGKDLMVESIIEQWQKSPMRPPIKMVHVWPLAFGELAV
jgi:hypothetical protein